MQQGEWFDHMKELARELHDESHNIERFSNGARPLGEVFGAVADLLEYLTNTSSWDLRQMQPYDAVAFKQEIEDKLAWRLRRSKS